MQTARKPLSPDRLPWETVPSNRTTLPAPISRLLLRPYCRWVSPLLLLLLLELLLQVC